MKKKSEQTASGVKFQGTMLLALAVAMVIAGGTAIAMQFLGVETVNPSQQTEVQQNETTEDTEQHQAEPVPADSGASSTDSDAVPPPLALAPQEGYCLMVMVGEANGYSEEATDLNTIRIASGLCAGLASSMAEALRVGLIEPGVVILPDWMLDLAK